MATVKIERKEEVAILRLSRGHGNAINEEMVEDLLQACKNLRGDPEVCGVLLASTGKLFCPGLDLQDLVLLDRRSMDRFMVRFREMLVSLYTLPRPVVASISGAAMAGGCVLALTADWRVLRRGAPIGLNEVKVGVPLPLSVTALLMDAVHPTALAEAALLGNNFEGEAALAAGLAHELADAAGFEERTLVRLAEFTSKDPASFSATKAHLRAPTAARMKSENPSHRKEWIDCWFSKETRRRIEQIVTGLKTRSA
ncbi:MAG: enoyl-CoA hydratase/isomerase family protein [Acidobacteria bacterium]|nr:enoyl-CoA hydratase/isomerase family protein [Acidobacteriota bacterium]